MANRSLHGGSPAICAAFGIHSKNIRIGEDQAKGYERAQFDDVFAQIYPRNTPNPYRGVIYPSHRPIRGKTPKIDPSQKRIWDG